MRYCHSFRSGIPLFRAGHQRVTHPFATNVLLHPFDLHVLGTPPAFILSQDQTLRCIFPYALFVRLFYTISTLPESLWFVSFLLLLNCQGALLTAATFVSGGKDWLYSLSRFRQVLIFPIMTFLAICQSGLFLSSSNPALFQRQTPILHHTSPPCQSALFSNFPDIMRDICRIFFASYSKIYWK